MRVEVKLPVLTDFRLTPIGGVFRHGENFYLRIPSFTFQEKDVWHSMNAVELEKNGGLRFFKPEALVEDCPNARLVID